MDATGKVGYGFLCQGIRAEKCTLSGDIFGDTKCKPGTLGSSKRRPNNGTKETGTIRGAYLGAPGGVLVVIGGGPEIFGVLRDGGFLLV